VNSVVRVRAGSLEGVGAGEAMHGPAAVRQSTPR